MKYKQKTIGIIIIVLSAILAVVGYIILPDKLIVQLQANGSAGNILPKSIGLFIPLTISVLFAFLYIKSERTERYERCKQLIISVVGIAIYGFIYIVNL